MWTWRAAGLGRSRRSVRLRWLRAGDREPARHRRARSLLPRPAATVGRAGSQGGRVPPDPGDPRSPADQLRARDVLRDVERALLLQVQQGAPAPLRRAGAGDAARQDPCGHRRERRRDRHRSGLRRDVQGRVAQPPELRRALPGCCDRSRRHRPRHPRHGRPAGGGDGPAALRSAGRAGHRAGAAGDRGRHRRLRQLPGAAEHRWRGRLRRDVRGQPAGQRLVRRRDAARAAAHRARQRRRQPGAALRRPYRR